MENSIKLLVVNRLSERHIATLTGVDPRIKVTTCEYQEISQYIADTDILVPWGWMDTSPFFAKAAKLRWIQTLSAGVEKVFPSVSQSDVLLTSARGIHGIPVSEHVLAMMLSFTRGLHVNARHQEKKLWQRTPVDELYEKTVGIIGLGSIGRDVAKKCKAMNMRVVAAKQFMTEELFIDLLLSPQEIDQLLEMSDYVVLAVPLTPATDNLLNAERIGKMKKTAFLVNISRGQVVNETALINALQTGCIRGAGLDVFETEPLPPDHPLWNFTNVIITPHVAALSPACLDRAIALVADNVARYLQGREMLNVVDKTKGY